MTEKVSAPERLENADKARTAPVFTAVDADGKTVRLSDYHGKNVVLVLNRGFV
jgi:peroxiredoxin